MRTSRVVLDLRAAPVLDGFGDGPARAADAFSRLRIRELLAPFDPVNVSSLASGLGLEDSDLDVACDLRTSGFEEAARSAFGSHEGFELRASGGGRTLVTFAGAGLRVELVGEPLPVEHQQAYRHAVAHRRAVEAGGPALAAAVRELRRRDGLKTEPALAAVLGLCGDPYEAVDALAEG